MKLLFDENVSFRLVALLASEFPGSEHVRSGGLKGTTDARIWNHAREFGYAIVSKDTDFRDRALVEGAPPKVIWLDVGNAGTQDVAGLLQRERARIHAFDARREESVLIVSLRRGTS